MNGASNIDFDRQLRFSAEYWLEADHIRSWVLYLPAEHNYIQMSEYGGRHGEVTIHVRCIGYHVGFR